MTTYSSEAAQSAGVRDQAGERVASPGAQRARILHSRRLGPWASAWDALVDLSPVPSPFLSSWWLEGVAGRRAHYLLVLDGDALVGGVALERRRVLGVDHYRVLGGGRLCPDHLDLLSRPEYLTDVVTAVREWFTGPGSRVAELTGLAEGARLLMALAPVDARVHRIEGAPYEPLTGGIEAFLAARSGSFAKKLRKSRRRAEARGVRLRRVAADEVPAAVDGLAVLHRPRRSRRPLLREMPRIRRAAVRGAAEGAVRAYVAEKDGRCGGVLLTFTSGGRLCTYQIGRLLEPAFTDVGTLLYLTAVEDACRDGLTEIDLLRGEEPYKRSFTSHQRELLQWRGAHGRGGHWHLRALLAAAAARRRLASWVRRVRSPRDPGGGQ